MASSTGVFMLSVVLGDSRGALLARPCLQGSLLQRALQALISSSQHSCEVASHYFHSTDDKAEASKGVVTSISHTYKAEHLGSLTSVFTLSIPCSQAWTLSGTLGHQWRAPDIRKGSSEIREPASLGSSKAAPSPSPSPGPCAE